MNKRDFLKKLIIGCVAPTIFIPKIEPIRWKKIRIPTEVQGYNNTYTMATFEIAYLIHPKAYKELKIDPQILPDSLIKYSYANGVWKAEENYVTI